MLKIWAIIAGIYSLGKVILLLGLLYETVAGVVERRRYPPPGRLVDVGGHKLHIWESGEGDGPTVVLESGAASPSLLWVLVQRALARETRVVLYDRAGYGWSDKAKGKRTGQAVVEDLHQLLHRAGVPGPYILVGHHLGGIYTRLYAHAHPEEVAGLVLVDARSEEFSRRKPAWLRWQSWLIFPLSIYLAYLGILRLLVRWKPGWLSGGRNLLPFFPEELREPVRVKLAQPRLYVGTWAEMRQVTQAEEQLRLAGKLGDLPLTVLTPGSLEIRGLPRRYRERLQRLWQEGQAALVSLSANSRQVTVKGSGHFIPAEAPEAIVQAVQEMLRTVATGRRT